MGPLSISLTPQAARHPATARTRTRIATLYRLEQVATALRSAHDSAAASLTELPESSPEEAFRTRMLLGGELVTALATDPLLPPELLPPEWPGTRLRELFARWNRLASAQAAPFIERAIRAGGESEDTR